MADSGKRWIVQDREGNSIYLTEERWGHIIDADNHPEMADMRQILDPQLMTPPTDPPYSAL